VPSLSRRRLIIINSLVALVMVSLAAAEWAARRPDLAAVRAALPPDSQATFDLLLALHPSGRRAAEWAKAERICRELAWPRCDRPALELLQQQSPPLFGGGGEPASAAALAVADATWAFGSEAAARKMFRTELDRLPETDGPRRARVFLRFGIIDTNPDGQAALFNQACVADAQICDHMKDAALREVRARFVPPGNVLPLYFSNGRGHPPIPPK